MLAALQRSFPACAALALALVLAACSNGDEEPETRADNVPNVPGTARLYVFNTVEPAFTIGKNTVFDYQKPLVTVSDGRYAIALIYGGRHVLSCGSMQDLRPVVFDATPGATYYFQMYSGGNGTQKICGFLPPERGKRLLAEIQNR